MTGRAAVHRPRPSGGHEGLPSSDCRVCLAPLRTAESGCSTSSFPSCTWERKWLPSSAWRVNAFPSQLGNEKKVAAGFSLRPHRRRACATKDSPNENSLKKFPLRQDLRCLAGGAAAGGHGAGRAGRREAGLGPGAALAGGPGGPAVAGGGPFPGGHGPGGAPFHPAPLRPDHRAVRPHLSVQPLHLRLHLLRFRGALRERWGAAHPDAG